MPPSAFWVSVGSVPPFVGFGGWYNGVQPVPLAGNTASRPLVFPTGYGQAQMTASSPGAVPGQVTNRLLIVGAFRFMPSGPSPAAVAVTVCCCAVYITHNLEEHSKLGEKFLY